MYDDLRWWISEENERRIKAREKWIWEVIDVTVGRSETWWRCEGEEASHGVIWVRGNSECQGPAGKGACMLKE